MSFTRSLDVDKLLVFVAIALKWLNTILQSRSTLSIHLGHLMKCNCMLIIPS